MAAAIGTNNRQQGGGSLVDDLLPLISTLAYPVDLEDPLSEIEPDISPLSDLAASQLCADPALLSSVFHLLPKSLSPTLLRASLLYGHDASLRFLVRKWPYQYIRLREIIPLPLVRSPLAIVYYESTLASFKLGIRLTTGLVRALLDCLADLNSSPLQFVDLSGFPLAEVVACYSAVQCQLVNTDIQRQEMVKNFNELVTMMKAEDEDDVEDIENRAVVDDGHRPVSPLKEYEAVEEKFRQPCALVFDLTLQHAHRVDDMMHALVWSKTPTCRFRLIMSALNLQGLGFDVITKILECTIKSELQSLDVAYNAMSGQTVLLLASLNASFVNLSKLDLSSNNLNLSASSNRAESASYVGSSLASLPSLRHLSLSKNRLAQSLAAILGPLLNPLLTLRVAGCGLREEDLAFLASSPHPQRYLDLSENNLGEPSCWTHMLTLLQDRGAKLYSLEMSRSFIGDDELNEILKLKGGDSFWRNLRFLNLSRNIIVPRFLRTIVQTFVYDAPRCVLYLPCPFNCREREETDENGHVIAGDGSHTDHDLAAHGAIKQLAPKNVKIIFAGSSY